MLIVDNSFQSNLKNGYNPIWHLIGFIQI